MAKDWANLFKKMVLRERVSDGDPSFFKREGSPDGIKGDIQKVKLDQPNAQNTQNNYTVYVNHNNCCNHLEVHH